MLETHIVMSSLIFHLVLTLVLLLAHLLMLCLIFLMVHAFPVVLHVPLDRMVKCKEL
jgi:hypothetical protein